MRSRVSYEEIQLLSIKEKKAIKINLKKNKLIIYGKNDTGKSTIIKSIFWLLGLEPASLFSGTKLDRNLMGILTINYNGMNYKFYRNKENRSLYSEKELLIQTESNSEWQTYLANLFQYPLSLIQYNNLEEYFIGLQGLLTPYYIDQDTSWNSKWIGPFQGLNRYVDFYQQVIEHFTGIISNETILLKQKQKSLINSKKEYDLKIKIYRQSQDELLENYEDLNQLPEIDEILFIKSIEESSDIFKKTKILQEELKTEISNVISQRYIIKNLIKSAINLRDESLTDLEKLDEIPNDSIIECPTCGTHHKKTLKANITLEFDIQGIEENIFFLKQQLKDIEKQEKNAIDKLNKINNEIEKFESQLNHKVADNYTFKDVLNTYSSQNIRLNIDSNIEKTQKLINEINQNIIQLDIDIDQFDSNESIKFRKEELKKFIQFFYNQLDVDSQILPSRAYLKPSLSGSSSSRCILAVHLAYIAMNGKYTNLPIFPIVIDTIQQNGQDIENLDKMVQVISSIDSTQIILGMETLATNTDDQGFKVHELNNSKMSLLSSDYYSEVMNNINQLIYS